MWGEMVQEKPKKPKTRDSDASGLQDDGFDQKHREALAELKQLQREQERATREREERNRREAEDRNRRDDERRREQQRQEDERRRLADERRREEERERQREADRERRREEEKERRRAEQREFEREQRREEERRERERNRSPVRPRPPRDDSKQLNDFMRNFERNLPKENEKRWEREQERKMEWERNHEREKERQLVGEYEEKKKAEVYDEKERQYAKWKKEWERNKSYDSPLHNAVRQAAQDPSLGYHSWRHFNRPFDDLHYAGRALRYDPVKPPKPKFVLPTGDPSLPDCWKQAAMRTAPAVPKVQAKVEKKEKKSLFERVFGGKAKVSEAEEPVPVEETGSSNEFYEWPPGYVYQTFEEPAGFPQLEEIRDGVEDRIDEVQPFVPQEKSESAAEDEYESFEWPPDYEYQKLEDPVGFPPLEEFKDAVEEFVHEDQQVQPEEVQASESEDEEEEFEWPSDYEYEEIEEPIGFPAQIQEDAPEQEEQEQAEEYPQEYEEQDNWYDSQQQQEWVEEEEEEESVPSHFLRSEKTEFEFEGFKKPFEDVVEDVPEVEEGETPLKQIEIENGIFRPNVKFFTPSGDIVKFGNKLGEGSFGMVFEGSRNGGEEKAFKVVEYKTPEQKEVVDREIKVLQIMSETPYGPRFDKAEEIPNHMLIEMEKLGKTLSKIARDETRFNRMFTKKEVYRVGEQMFKALAHLHESGFIHGDIKVNNICTKDDDLNQIKLVDFGSVVDINNPPAIQTRATLSIKSPEAVLQLPFNEKVDTFAAGCTLIKMITGDTPFEAYDPLNHFEFFEQTKMLPKNAPSCPQYQKFKSEIERKPLQQIDNYISKFIKNSSSVENDDQFISYAEKMLSPEVSERPTAKEIVEMKWFQQ